MFFPIIGCFLTLLSPIQSVTPYVAPQQLQQTISQSNQFFGAYNFRDTIYSDLLVDNNLTPQDLEEEFSFLDSNIYVYNYTNGLYVNYDKLEIEYNGADSYWSLTFSLASTIYTTFNLNLHDVLTNQSNNVKNFTIYFPKYYYYDNETSNIFNFFFTKELNQYHEYYTGYYTFNSNPNGGFYLLGNISANNNLFNLLEYETNTIKFSYVPGDVIFYQLYGNSKWNSSRSIYMSGVVIPQSLKAYMDERGVFAYIPQTELSDFQDLFFSIADTPIYYLTTWFDFSLLGFNVGLAITSLLTLLLIIFILRKLI